MKIALAVAGVLFGLLAVGFIQPIREDVGVETSVDLFKRESRAFASATKDLADAVAALEENNPETIADAREALIESRLQYKKIEYFLTYFFESAALIYNRPPKYEIEEPFMEFDVPIGLQVIEGLLFEENVALKKEELVQQADAISSSASDLNSLLFGFKTEDRMILESVRLQLIRIISLGIAGFDAPLLKSGITESEASLGSLREALQPFLTGGATADSVSGYLDSGIEFLGQHRDFESFDRMAFLRYHALPLQRHLGRLIQEKDLSYNTTSDVLNYDAPDLFSDDAINIHAFPGIASDSDLIELGKRLFFERGLSGNNRVSCASCHDPEKHFADGLDKSIGFDGHSPVERNAATLLYAGFQFEQFWDGRAKSLQEQVKTVIGNPKEMNGGESTVRSLLQRKPEYALALEDVFSEPADSTTMLDQVAASIAAYVSTLNPRSSRFDHYIKGDDDALTPDEIRGFNLFMGKAQCGTCHFAPLFNGLTPPLYNLSELEVLGTTKTDDFTKPELDADRGRFDVFPMEFYQKAFKTPTVRNASATAPYMHNGSFKTLESVVEFYNKGGAVGLGLELDNQTLSAEPLNLSKEEVSAIVSFLGALEDTIDIQE